METTIYGCSRTIHTSSDLSVEETAVERGKNIANDRCLCLCYLLRMYMSHRIAGFTCAREYGTGGKEGWKGDPRRS